MFAKLAEHSDLMNRMAEHTGVDLTQALRSGEIGAMAYRDRTIRCSNCTKVEACRGFLQRAHAEHGDPPDYCVNRDFFGRLAEDK